MLAFYRWLTLVIVVYVDCIMSGPGEMTLGGISSHPVLQGMARSTLHGAEGYLPRRREPRIKDIAPRDSYSQVHTNDLDNNCKVQPACVNQLIEQNDNDCFCYISGICNPYLEIPHTVAHNLHIAQHAFTIDQSSEGASIMWMRLLYLAEMIYSFIQHEMNALIKYQGNVPEVLEYRWSTTELDSR